MPSAWDAKRLTDLALSFEPATPVMVRLLTTSGEFTTPLVEAKIVDGHLLLVGQTLAAGKRHQPPTPKTAPGLWERVAEVDTAQTAALESIATALINTMAAVQAIATAYTRDQTETLGSIDESLDTIARTLNERLPDVR